MGGACGAMGGACCEVGGAWRIGVDCSERDAGEGAGFEGVARFGEAIGNKSTLSLRGMADVGETTEPVSCWVSGDRGGDAAIDAVEVGTA